METQQKHLSIKVIYWVTQVSFWLFAVMGIAMIGIAFALLFNLINDDLNLHVGLPVAFDVIEKGNLQVLSKTIPVEFKEAYGKVGFSELPASLGRIYGIFILVVVGIFFYIIKMFRRFISNVYKGKVFEQQNFKLLNLMGYSLLIFWGIIIIYSFLQNFLIAQHLSFETLKYSGDMELHMEVVFISLLLIVLSHIFKYGTQLKEDNELTI